MSAAHGSIEGITFMTCPEGHRFERTQLRASAVAISLGAFCWYGFPQNRADWATIVFEVLIFLVPVMVLSFTYDSSAWASTFRVEGDHVRLMKRARTRNIPLADLRGIRVKYSRDGSHRLVTLVAPYRAYYRVRDPEHGEALETWAKNEAAGMGLDVRIRQSWFLGLGRHGTWVLYCAVGAVGGLLAGVLYPI